MVDGLIVATQVIPVSSAGMTITLSNDFNSVTSAEFLIASDATTSLDNIHIGPPIPEPSPIIIIVAWAALIVFRRQRL